MIAEIIPASYDACGSPVPAMVGRRDKFFNRTYPMARYVSKPLRHRCVSVREVREFLRGCTYVSDQKQFEREEFWLPPDEFENE